MKKNIFKLIEITNPVIKMIHQFMLDESKKRKGTVYKCNEVKLEIPLADDLILKFEFGNRDLRGGYHGKLREYVCGLEIRGWALKPCLIKFWDAEEDEFDDPKNTPSVDYEEDGSIDSIILSIISWCGDLEPFLKLKP